MKKLTLALSLLFTPAIANATCVKAVAMGEGFYRCENVEAICYLYIDAKVKNSEPPISCFKK